MVTIMPYANAPKVLILRVLKLEITNFLIKYDGLRAPLGLDTIS